MMTGLDLSKTEDITIINVPLDRYSELIVAEARVKELEDGIRKHRLDAKFKMNLLEVNEELYKLLGGK